MNTSAKAESIFAPVSVPLLKPFLTLLDRTTEVMGLHVQAIVDLEYLRSLPSDSFGKAWANHLDESNLLPFSAGMRLKQIHDGVHVLTGYDTTPLGEAQVQLFLLGTKFRVRHLVLCLGLLRPMVRGLRKNRSLERFPDVVRSLWEAFQRGQQASFDIETWQPELSWHVPIDVVLAQLEIYRIEQGSVQPTE
jgi:ubiquinone biosynthesis protein COQ4